MRTGSLITLGETMALFYAERVGSLSHLPEVSIGVGGSESNVAIAATRLGAVAHWVGRVGADSLGDRVVRELRGEGVHVHCHEDQTANTGLMVKERLSANTTSVRYYRENSAGSRLAANDIPDHLWDSAAVLHVTGITLALSESAADAVRTAAQRARKEGVLVSFDVNHRDRLWGASVAALAYREMAASSDIIFAGVEEAGLICDAGSPEQMAQRIAEMGPRTVVIKRGEKGAFALVEGEPFTVDAVAVCVEDTVGAGDAFVGAYLAEMIAGESPEVGLATAAAAGAYACTMPGDWEGFPTRKRLVAMSSDVDPVDR